MGVNDAAFLFDSMIAILLALHHAALGQRHRTTAADDKMVEYAYADQGQGATEFGRNGAIGLAGLGYARRMVVGEDHSRRIVLEARAYDLARVYVRTIERAAKELFERDDAMAIVEKHAGEDFHGTARQARMAVCRRSMLLLTISTALLPMSRSIAA